MKRPLVSVALPVHNGGSYLAAAVRSILDQSLADLELIVGDNCSTDETAAVLAGFGDSRLRVVRSKELLHIADSHNFAAAEARGEYLAFMGADDIAAPQRLDRQLEALRDDPELAIVSAWARLIDERGRLLGSLRFPATDAGLRRVRFRYHAFILSALTMRSALFRALGGFDRRYDGAMDYDLTFRAMERARAANLPELLCDVRFHTSRTSLRSLRSTQLGSVRVRLAALRRGGYSPVEAVWILKPLVISKLPAALAGRLLTPYTLLAHGGRSR